MYFAIEIVLLLLAFAAPGLRADLVDTAASEEQARNAFIDRFTRFTQDKNVMGKPRTPDGKAAVGSGRKRRFNRDDGLAYESDLTYHDFAYDSEDKEPTQKGQPPVPPSPLYAFVSSHGKDKSGNSSSLERVAYALNKQFMKQDAQKKNQDDEKGVLYESIFKITTQEVEDDPNPSKNPAGGPATPKAKKRTVFRSQLRDGAKQPIEKVGEDSFETIRQSARDEESKTDPNALGNGVLLRYAAGAATEALWNSSLANKTQRQIYKGARVGALPEPIKLSEGAAQCEAWSATVSKTELANEKDPKKRDELQKEITRMANQCQSLAKLPFNSRGAKYESDPNGKGPDTLKAVQEDSFARDYRVQLEMMAKAGKDAQSVDAKWKYTDADNRAKVSIVMEDGTPKEEQLTVKEQLEGYNNQIREAAKGVSDVATRLPTLKMDPNEVLKYQIQPETKTMMEINQPPDVAMEELGVPQAPGLNLPPAKNYSELIQRARQ